MACIEIIEHKMMKEYIHNINAAADLESKSRGANPSKVVII